MKYFLVLFLLTLAACASYEVKEREFDPALCEEAISYQAGFNDGREGRNMNSSYAFRCREDLRTGSMKGYKEGYDKGLVEYNKMLEERRKQMAEMRKENEERREREKAQQNNGTTIILPTPGIIIGGGSAYNPKEWYCTLDVFTDTFEAYGSTKLEAFNTLRQNCISKRGDDFFCKERDSKCKENR
jgi:hypothetical protein